MSWKTRSVPNTWRVIATSASIPACPLAAGEQWANKWEFRQAIEEELIDYVRIDICIAGGLDRSEEDRGHGRDAPDQDPARTTLWDRSALPASLHLDLACNNAGPQEVIFPPATMLPDVFECAFELQGTRLTVPTAPGIGVQVQPEAAASTRPR